MRIAVVGAGALGLYYGALLQRSGAEVCFLLRRDYAAIRAGGLKVESVNGDFHLPNVAGYLQTEEIGVVDLVLIGLKAFANVHMADLVRPLVGPQTALLTLQNGLGNEACLAEVFPSAQIMGGIAFLCANRGAPGTVRHLGEGRIRLGEYTGGLTPRAERIADLFSTAGIPCEAVADLARARWEKLVWNIPFNGLCALTGQDVTELLAQGLIRSEIHALMSEVVAAGNAQGFSHPIDADGFIPRLIGMTEKMDHYRPSMMIDRLAGHPLELEAIYSLPLHYAAQRGVAMPRTAMLHALLNLGEKN
jgi:2-dehydropantoate 2-reductase